MSTIPIQKFYQISLLKQAFFSYVTHLANKEKLKPEKDKK